MKLMPAPTAYLSLILLGASISFVFGSQEVEIAPEPDPPKDNDSAENRSNIQLMDVLQQYASKLDNSGEDNNTDEGKRSIREQPEIDDTDSLAPEVSREFGFRYRGFGLDSDTRAEFPIDKRIIQLQKNPEDMGFKSRPGFRSWGGKRAKFGTWGGKRVKFATWGGKRARFVTWGGKKSKFNNWGGKRYLEPYKEESILYELPRRGSYGEDEIEKWVEDRTDKFKSWGGKRSQYEDREENQTDEKRDTEYPISYDQGKEADGDDDEYKIKRTFQSWGGKRTDNSQKQPTFRNLKNFLKWGGKRKFSSWAGKRSYAANFEECTDGEMRRELCLSRNRDQKLMKLTQNDLVYEKRNTFPDKLFNEDSDFMKSGFYPWKGKR